MMNPYVYKHKAVGNPNNKKKKKKSGKRKEFTLHIDNANYIFAQD